MDEKSLLKMDKQQVENILKMSDAEIDKLADDVGNKMAKNMQLAKDITNKLNIYTSGSAGIITTSGSNLTQFTPVGWTTNVVSTDWTSPVQYQMSFTYISEDDIKKIALEVIKLLDERDERKRLDAAIQHSSQLGDREI